MQTVSITSWLAMGLAATTVLATDVPTPRTSNFISKVPRIIGGHPAPQNEYGYVAYIEADDFIARTASSCTGSLIAPNIVLTAAHCAYKNDFLRYPASAYNVGFVYKLPDPTVMYHGRKISKMVVHKDFSMRTMKNDIALIFLEDSVPSSVATPVKIYTGGYSAGDLVRAAGFGVTDPDNERSYPNELMEVDLHIGKNSLCRRMTPHYNPRTAICTDGTPGKDTCQGDSGGPLTIKTSDSKSGWALFGLTSYGPITIKNPLGKCAQAGVPGYYTHIAAYMDWIAKAGNLKASDISVGNGSGIRGPSDSDSDSDSDPDSGSSRTTGVSDTFGTTSDGHHGSSSTTHDGSARDTDIDTGSGAAMNAASLITVAAVGAVANYLF